MRTIDYNRDVSSGVARNSWLGSKIFTTYLSRQQLLVTVKIGDDVF